MTSCTFVRLLIFPRYLGARDTRARALAVVCVCVCVCVCGGRENENGGGSRVCRGFAGNLSTSATREEGMFDLSPKAK